MAILRPEHLLEQADRLVEPLGAGAPRQVDLRRAISSAYYGVFHAMMIAVSDEFVGVAARTTPRYALAYRSVDHRALRFLCEEATKPTLKPRYARYVPQRGFDTTIKTFAAAVVELQEKRHGADYDPLIKFKASDALLAIRTARSALERFQKASPAQRKAFLALLLFPLR